MFNDVFTALTSRKTELCKILIQLNEIIKHEYQLDRILEEMKKSLNEFQEGAPETSSGVMLMFRFFG